MVLGFRGIGNEASNHWLLAVQSHPFRIAIDLFEIFQITK